MIKIHHAGCRLVELLSYFCLEDPPSAFRIATNLGTTHKEIACQPVGFHFIKRGVVEFGELVVHSALMHHPSRQQLDLFPNGVFDTFL